jgi:hypothetical protein
MEEKENTNLISKIKKRTQHEIAKNIVKRKKHTILFSK